MEQCLKSFQIRIERNSFTAVDGATGTSVRTWGTPGQYFFSAVFKPGSDSQFNITGFKNINIHGITATGFVRGASNSTKCAVVQDWNFLLVINGTPSLISGFVRTSPNGFNLVTEPPGVLIYNISKHTPTIILSDPIASVKSIDFDSIYAQGIGAEFLNEIAFNYNFNFTFYYKYEGED
jgi:hypothetical protein